ncbi:MAG: fluoride efflux transporter CrcB [Saprospiraceae bacterium]|nr:fluoride efflux transporter CrcB [Saprospiraceae bacterium]
MKIVLLVGAGSFLGGAARYWISQWMHHRFPSSFPYGTFTINIIGCLAIGMILGWAEKGNLSSDWKFFLASGICGGFTTFSAFSWEILSLIRQGQLPHAFLYISASVILGLLGTYLGWQLSRM